MGRYVFVVLNTPIPGHESEYNAHYDNLHLPDVLRVPGVKSGQRFQLAQARRAGEPSPWKYFAFYEIETDNLQGVIDEIARRAGTEQMPLNPHMAQHRFAHYFEPMGPKKPGTGG
jgi:hypothetical protein